MFTLLDYWNSAPGSAILTESGRRIVERRNALKISQAALLEHLRQHAGIKSRTIISEWEHGKRRIETIGQLAALADLLQCDPEYITCQSDTLRKEYHDPARRFGLSEQSFAVLEMSEELAAIDRKIIQQFPDVPADEIGSQNATADMVNFVLENDSVHNAFCSLLGLLRDRDENADRTASAWPDKPDSQIRDKIAAGEILPFPKDGGTAYHSYLDFMKDDNSMYAVSGKQAAFIAEQQLIAEIRKALEK